MLITESRFVGRLCAPHITKDPYDKVGGASFQRKKINSINLEIVEQYEYGLRIRSGTSHTYNKNY